jgi:hypothetical protein
VRMHDRVRRSGDVELLADTGAGLSGRKEALKRGPCTSSPCAVFLHTAPLALSAGVIWSLGFWDFASWLGSQAYMGSVLDDGGWVACSLWIEVGFTCLDLILRDTPP